MSLIRKRTLKQLYRINDFIKKQGGDIHDKTKTKEKVGNEIYTKNPLDMKKIQSYEDFYSVDESKKNDDSEKSVIDINKDINKINNYHYTKNQPSREFNVLNRGKYIDTGKIKGFIQRIEGKYAYLETNDGTMDLVKVKLSDIVKPEKKDKVKIHSVSDLSLQGPILPQNVNKPEISKDKIKELTDKAKPQHKKLTDKIYKEKKISENVKTFENFIKESLLFIPKSEKDFNLFKNKIEDSDFYAEINDIEKYFSFDEENPDELEKEITNLILIPNNINGHFELE